MPKVFRYEIIGMAASDTMDKEEFTKYVKKALWVKGLGSDSIIVTEIES